MARSDVLEVESLLRAKHPEKIDKVTCRRGLVSTSWCVETKPLFIPRVGRLRNVWLGRFAMRFKFDRRGRRVVEFERLSKGGARHYLTPYFSANARSKTGNLIARNNICFGTGAMAVEAAKTNGDAFTVLDAMLTIINQTTGRRMVFTSWTDIIDDQEYNLDDELEFCEHCSALKEECICKTCSGGKLKKEHRYQHGCELCKSCRRHCSCKSSAKVRTVAPSQFDV